jgi:hypothetical protein
MQSKWGKKDEMEESECEKYTIIKKKKEMEKKEKINETLRI